MSRYSKTFSIIVLTKDSKGFIRACLDSVYNQEYKDFEVVVVDNGSTDGTGELIEKSYPDAVLIKNAENLGACKARNQGIAVSNGEWILTLDSDVVLDKDFLSQAVTRIKSMPPDIGILQPKIFCAADKDRLYSCGIHLTWMRRFYDIGKHKKDTKSHDKQKEVFAACSAAAFYKRGMLDEIKEETGYFDERFFFLIEDIDLAWRARKKNWRVVFSPELRCYHSGNSSSTGRKLRQHLCFRNRLLMIKKNEGYKNYSRRVLPLLFYDLPRFIYLFITNLNV